MPNATPETSVPDSPRERLNSLIAITLAVLAALMGITKVKDDNIVQAMQLAKVNAVDTWGEYQAKKMKHHLAEASVGQLTALQLLAPTNTAPQFAAMLERHEQNIARYQREEKELMEKARSFEREYDLLNFRDDQFDLSDGALSIAMCLLATASLSNRRWLLVLAWVFGTLGLLMAVAGFLQLKLHPDWLVRILS